jgi:AcrR family transcriptional regulator
MDKNNRASQSDHSYGKDQNTGTRRRGEILENALLQAAWEELNEVGYTHLTMEGVAIRAKTNKTALYRRWPNKPELVIAAVRKYTPKPADDVPDTGDLRSDLLIMLRRITQPIEAIGAETIHGLMIEYVGKELFSALPHVKRSDLNEKWNAAMTTILNNAKMRGEAISEKISTRILSLPIDLLRYEILTTYKPVSDETVTEIVDNIFIPLIHIK